MSILTYIKSFFTKELSAIIAPLEKIHADLDAFMDRVSTDIADNVKKISVINLENDLKKAEQETAVKVKANLATLLGKI